MRAMGTALQFVLLLLLSGSPALAQRTTVTMATATPGGGFMLFGDQAAKAMSAADPSLDVVTRSTKGSSENIKLLEARAIDLGLVAGLPAYEALAGIGRPKANLKILAAIYSSPGMFVVSGASPARSVRDLVGKPIAWGTRASGLTLMAKYVMDGLGLDRDKDFKPHFLEKAGDGPGMVKDGRVAAFWGGGVGWPGFTRVMKDGGRFVGLTPEEIAKVAAKHSFLKPMTVPAGAYPGQTEPVHSVGAWAYILVRPDLPDELAYRLAKALHKGHGPLVAALAQARETTPENTLRAAPRPDLIHPGVRKYLAEIGVK